MAKLTEIKCQACGGTCHAKRIATGTAAGILWLIIAGLVLVLGGWTPAGIVIAVLIGLIGLHYAGKAENVWLCSQCESKYPRR